MPKIAVIRRNGLGDLLCAFPLITYLQKKFGEKSVALFVDESNAPLLPYLGFQGEAIIFPKKGNKYWNLVCLALKFRRSFDIVISAKTSPMKMVNLFLFLLGAKKRIASVDHTWHCRLINHGVKLDTSAHQALKGLRLVAPEMDHLPETLWPKISIPSEKKRNLSFDLLISASTTRVESRLEEKRYATLVNRLGVKNVLIVAQKQDELRAESIRSFLEVSSELHFPRNFEDFMLWLDVAKLYFVGDGGIAHIGAALGKHEVVLFGIERPERWAPLSSKCLTFHHPKHVNELSDELIFNGLKRKWEEVNGREHL